MHVLITMVVCYHDPLKALCSKQCAEHVVEHIHAILKSLEMLCSRLCAAIDSAALKKPTHPALLSLDWRKIRQRQKIIALEMSPFRHKLLPTLIIDQASDRIWECALIWIARRSRTYRVALHHPTRSKP